MSTTFETVETLASYDEHSHRGGHRSPASRSGPWAEQLRRDFPPEHHVAPAGDEAARPGDVLELDLVAGVDGRTRSTWCCSMPSTSRSR